MSKDSTTDKGRPRTNDKGSSTKAKPAEKARTVVVEESVEVPPAEPRDAVLRLTHIDPWSVTRMAFVISVALMIVAVVATAIFWAVLNMLGVWDQISDSVTAVLSDAEDAFDITDYLGMGRLVGLAMLLSVVNVIAMTVLATIAAHLYNLAAYVLGGFQVTFSNDK